MDLLDVLPILRRRWLVLVGTLLAVLVLAVGYLSATQETYRASAEVFVATGTSDNAASQAQATAFALTRVRSYVDLVATPAITEPVIEELGLPTTPEALAARIEASVPLNTVLVDILVTADTASGAAEVTQAVAEQFVTYVTDLERDGAAVPNRPSTDDQDSSEDPVAAPEEPVALTIIHPAEVPDAPISPRTTLTLVLAVLAGLVGGAGLAVLRDRLDTRVRTEHGLGPAAPPVLGTVEQVRRAAAKVPALRHDPKGARAEDLRHLRTNLEFVNRDRPVGVLAVVSASAGDGRTSLAIDVAMVMAEAGRTVVLVDAALRRPAVAERLTLDGSVGLADALADAAAVESLLVDVTDGLQVLPAGHRVPNPAEVLASERLGRVIDELRDRADLVVVDTSPLLESADAAAMVPVVDATLLVARVGRTRRAAVDRALERLERVQRPAVGVVLLGVAGDGGYGRYARTPSGATAAAE